MEFKYSTIMHYLFFKREFFFKNGSQKGNSLHLLLLFREEGVKRIIRAQKTREINIFKRSINISSPQPIIMKAVNQGRIKLK